MPRRIAFPLAALALGLAFGPVGCSDDDFGADGFIADLSVTTPADLVTPPDLRPGDMAMWDMSGDLIMPDLAK